jgi:hypothetical protein
MKLRRKRDEGEAEIFRCSLAARWLPRALAASVLAAATLAAFRMDPHGILLGSTWLRNGIALAGALAALWIVRKWGETRITATIDDDGLLLSHGSRSSRLPFARMSRLGYAAPFAATRNWLPAMLIWDKHQGCWRILSLMHEGDRLLRTLLEKADREDLATWAESLQLERRMAASGRRVMIGYILSAVILTAGLLYHFHE